MRNYIDIMQHILMEAMSTTWIQEQTWYHGSKNKFLQFDIARTGKGNDKEGSGFYFSTSMDTARQYGNNIFVCRINPKKILQTKGSTATIRNKLISLMKNSPDLNFVLSNWDENPKIAFNTELNAMLEEESPKMAFEAVWYNFYKDNPSLWMKQMGEWYSGFILEMTNSHHFICFDPKAIVIEEIITEQ
jgi:hypothetical protein